ncbi:MAG: prenyltransferase [Pseudomonadota bacterium]
MSLAFDRVGGPLAPFTGALDVILAQQTQNGAIPWFDKGPWDPWNHAECLMALGAMGEFEAADRGFEYLAWSQEASGAWLGEYGNTLPMADRLHMARTPAAAFRDSNFAAYPAVALWHRYRLDNDLAFARRYWPMVKSAIDFVLTLQHPEGDISWSQEAFGTGADDAVLAGNASIFKSLDCALKLADLLGEPQPGWRLAKDRLSCAIRNAPARFDRLQDRSDFAMDWYYPALAGVLSPGASFARLEARAPRFAVLGRGCRCVASEPWVTVAESCELALALLSLGARAAACALLDAQLNHRDDDGAFWMGWQFAEQIVWPRERPTWTQAAAILAFDARLGASAAHDVLISRT